jgi:phosphohistidine phosphatase
MQLFVIRHAEAVPRSPTLEDEARPLTELGRRRFKQVARGMKRLGISFDQLYHSPWLRAVQTANELSSRAQVETIVTQHLAAAPSLELIQQLSGPSAALVGHEPWLGELVAWLVLGRPQEGHRFELKKGCVVWLEGPPEPAQMRLRAWLPAELLRRI